MKIIIYLLLITSLISCTKKEETTTVVEPTIDQTLELTNVSKYFFGGDVLTTDVLYAPQGISMGDIVLDEKITKTILLKNNPLYEDFATDIKIEEKAPKIFGIEKNECSILKTGSSCKITLNALYSDNLFTSTKTARLVLGKKDGVDLYIEIYAQIKNVNISSSQFESNYSISMNESFSVNYSQFSFQQRTVSIKNNSLTKYLRNDFLIPRLVGSNPADFYISSNDCMYPVSPNDSCDIRVIYKKWKTKSEVSDTEIKLPNLSQNYSLKYAQLVTYSPVYSAWGTCSKSSICSGVGVQTRTMSDCIKNSLYSVSVENCIGSEVLSQACNSPAGNQTIAISGGTKDQSCSEGSTTWVDQSVACNSDFHASGLNCISDVFLATYSSYSPATNPLTTACTGSVNGTRSVVSCVREHNSEVVSNSKCVDPNPTITYNSPQGTRSVNITNGVQSQTCLEGSTTWVITNVSCDNGYYRNGNVCDPITYVPTFSAYSTSPVESTVCAGSDVVSRSILSCVMQHNGQSVANSFCSDPNQNKTVYSPSGSQLITLYDSNTSNAMGIQSQSCSQGGTTWNPVSTNCYQYYSVNGTSCVANNLASPTVSNLGPTIYSNSSTFVFSVSSDLNSTNLTLYSDISCSQTIGTGIYTGLSWTSSVTFPANVLTSVYAKTTNSYTLKESSCTYLFDYMYDSIAPTGSFSLNNGASKTTKSSVTLDFSSASDNSGSIQNIKIFEQASCSGISQNLAYQNNLEYFPSTLGTNLTISAKLIDAAGNESSCLQDSIFFGLESLSLYTNGNNWNSYVDLSGNSCSGSGSCIHSGEKRVVRLDQTSCNLLTMSDDYGLFDWSCEDDPDNVGKVRFVSTIAKGKGINLLIDDTQSSPAWKTNKVSLFLNQTVINTSESTTWYSNPLSYVSSGCYNSSNVFQPSLTNYTDCVAVVGNFWNVGSSPTSATNLSGSANTIFVVKKTNRSLIPDENVYSSGLVLNQNSIGLVVMPEVFLISKSTATNLVSATGRNYLYVEGQLLGTLTNLVETSGSASNSGIIFSNSNYGLINYGLAKNFSNGIRLSSSNYFNIQNFNASLNTNYGIYLTSSSNNILSRNSASSNASSGLYLETSSNSNQINESSFSNNLGSSFGGIVISGSQLNRLFKNSSSNNAGKGLYLSLSSSNIISQSSFNSNNLGGIFSTGSSFNRFSNINLVENMVHGVNFTSSSNSNLVHNLLVVNNDKIGIMVQGSDRNFFSQISIFTTTNSSAAEGAISFSTSNYNKISGNYYEGMNSISCNRNGLTDSSGISSSCSSAGLSDFAYVSVPSTMPSTSSFVSQSFSNFSYSIYSLIDLISENISFKKDDSSFGPTSRGKCSSGNCVAFDYSLSNTDQLFRNSSNLANSQNSAAVIQSNQICPSEVAGNIILSYAGCYIASSWTFSYKDSATCVSNGGTWSSLDTAAGTFSSPKVFLKNAIEVVDPKSKMYSAGNHDGLCEAGESCIYSPNFGVYQGEGTLSSCLFDPQGGLSSISIWGYSQNGR